MSRSTGPSQAQITQKIFLSELQVFGVIRGCRVRMRAEGFGAGRVLLRTSHFLRPHEPIGLLLWPGTDDHPVCAVARAQYVEKTWAGYFIDATLDKMPARDLERWEAMVADCSDSAADVNAVRKLIDGDYRLQLLAIGQTLDSGARSTLSRRGIVVRKLRTAKQGRLSYRPDVIVADTRDLTIERLSYCKKLCTEREGPPFLILTDGDSEKDFDAYLEAGATRIILKPCDEETLIPRIYTTLIERAELKGAADRSAATLLAIRQPVKLPNSALGLWSSLRGYLRGIVHSAS